MILNGMYDFEGTHCLTGNNTTAHSYHRYRISDRVMSTDDKKGNICNKDLCLSFKGITKSEWSRANEYFISGSVQRQHCLNSTSRLERPLIGARGSRMCYVKIWD